MAVMAPELVIGPSEVPSEVIPCALSPDTLIEELLTKVLFEPLPKSPCAPSPLVVINPLFISVLVLPMAAMPLEETPDVVIAPPLVSVFPVAPSKTRMALEFVPVVVIVSVFNNVLFWPPSDNIPSDSNPEG